jgi:hypothetical protein
MGLGNAVQIRIGLLLRQPWRIAGNRPWRIGESGRGPLRFGNNLARRLCYVPIDMLGYRFFRDNPLPAVGNCWNLGQGPDGLFARAGQWVNRFPEQPSGVFRTQRANIGYQFRSRAGRGLKLVSQWVHEILNKRFRSPEEISRELGLPIFGHIPLIGSRGKGLRKSENEQLQSLAPILCVAHHPKGRQAEAYRGVRTGIYFSTRAEGHRLTDDEHWSTRSRAARDNARRLRWDDCAKPLMAMFAGNPEALSA